MERSRRYGTALADRSDIDLRSDITPEQAENDQVLGLCLQQIDGCRPFLFGRLGERYGRVPLRVRDALLTCREGHTESVSVLSFSPDGATVATGAEDQTLRLWDAEGDTPARFVAPQSDGEGSLAFAPDLHVRSGWGEGVRLLLQKIKRRS